MTRRLTFKQWFDELDDPVPLQHVGRLLEMDQPELLREVRAGRLPVHRFKADDGRVWRVVKLSDLMLYRINPLDKKQLMRAAAAVVSRWARQAA